MKFGRAGVPSIGLASALLFSYDYNLFEHAGSEDAPVETCCRLEGRRPHHPLPPKPPISRDSADRGQPGRTAPRSGLGGDWPMFRTRSLSRCRTMFWVILRVDPGNLGHGLICH